MTTIVTRSGKGSELTFAEMDANLTNLNTDKLESVSITATASGALANGDLVVVNSDGTVSVVSGSFTAQSYGSDVTFDTVKQGFRSTTHYDPDNQKIVIAYYSTDFHGHIVAGTVSNGAITFDTDQEFYGTAGINSLAITYDPTEDAFVIFFTERGSGSGGDFKAIAATCDSDGVFTFGSVVSISTGLRAVNEQGNAFYHPTAGACVTTFMDVSNLDAYIVAVTVSGTTITAGTPQDTTLPYGQAQCLGFDESEETFIVYGSDTSNSGARSLIAATLSGTTFTFGTSNTSFATNGDLTQLQAAMTYDPDEQHVVLSLVDYTQGRFLYHILTTSGTTLTVGSEVLIEEGATLTGYYHRPVYDTNVNKLIIPSYYSTYVGTWGGSAYTWEEVAHPSGGGARAFVGESVFDASDNSSVFIYFTGNNGIAFTFKPENDTRTLTAENFVGISDGAYSDGTTATIQIAGSIDDAQTGLTAGQEYFVQNNNTLALTPDTPNVYAGKAISATEILIGHNRQITSITDDLSVTGDVDVTGEFIADSYNETYASISISSNTVTVDCESGNVFSVTLDNNVTTTTFSNPPASGTAYAFALRLVQDATGGRTFAFPSTVDWAAATAPTISSDANAVDWYVFTTVDGGTTWYGFTAGQALG